MVFSQWALRAVVLATIALLAACTTYTEPGRDTAPVEAPQVEPQAPVIVKPPPSEHETPPRAATHSASAAWRPLLANAAKATGRGDYEQALALLERAQRIDPDNAQVYLGIAETHRAKGDAAQAKAMAERGLLYCSSVALCDALRALAH